MAMAPRPVLLLCLLLLVSHLLVAGAWKGRKVGGRTQVNDVDSNEEVQGLGGFAVDEYNRKLREREEPKLSFTRVVEAQKQVVAGIKYYLKLEVGNQGRYEAVVVVRPWVGSKELLSFSPAVSH